MAFSVDPLFSPSSVTAVSLTSPRLFTSAEVADKACLVTAKVGRPITSDLCPSSMSPALIPYQGPDRLRKAGQGSRS